MTYFNTRNINVKTVNDTNFLGDEMDDDSDDEAKVYREYLCVY